jgi:hypothetical protein
VAVENVGEELFPRPAMYRALTSVVLANWTVSPAFDTFLQLVDQCAARVAAARFGKTLLEREECTDEIETVCDLS